MTIRGSAILSLLLGALTLAACGSSGTKTVPKAQIISKGDAICTRLEATAQPPPKVDPSKATGAKLKSLAPFLTKNADIIHSAVQQVGALGKPDKDASLFNVVLAEGRSAESHLRAAAAAAAAGNRTAFLAAFASLRNAPQHGKQFGFKKCDVPS
jgi:hypothetical protein